SAGHPIIPLAATPSHRQASHHCTLTAAPRTAFQVSCSPRGSGASCLRSGYPQHSGGQAGLRRSSYRPSRIHRDRAASTSPPPSLLVSSSIFLALLAAFSRSAVALVALSALPLR